MQAPVVLVAGAGPTGMTMAIELKRAGLDIRIVDKSDHLAIHSQALVVQARTLEQFQRYGIAGAAVERGRKLRNVKFFSEGKNILTFALERVPSRYPYLLFLPQDETETILNGHMESLGVRTERGIELISLSQQKDAVVSVLLHADGHEEQVESRWVVGCDGAHSTVRKLAAIPFEGAGVGLSFILGDLEIEGPDVPADELALHLNRGDVVFMGRLSEKLTRVIVALHAEQAKQYERDLTIEDFQDAIDRAGLRLKVRSAGWMTPFRVSDRQADHYRAGNVFLAGDAAHIHSPVGGQGMNTGIQDAANLGWKLAAVARGADEQLLDSYEEERGEVGKKLLKFTERGLKLATTTNPLLEWLRDALFPLVSKPKVLQDMFVGFISETAIEYRASSVVADHGGDGHLRAGDRIPDLDIGKPEKRRTLLRDWTDGRHLMVLINAPEDQAQSIAGDLPQMKVISLAEGELDPRAKKLLGVAPKVIVVRPDGYIGFRGPLDAAVEIDEYMRQDGLYMLAAGSR